MRRIASSRPSKQLNIARLSTCAALGIALWTACGCGPEDGALFDGSPRADVSTRDQPNAPEDSNEMDVPTITSDVPNPRADSGVGQDVVTARDVPAGGDSGVPMGPWVRVLNPANNAMVPAMVSFRTAASMVSTVRLYADEYPLANPWDPAMLDNLTYAFTGPARQRLVVLRGFNAAGDELARDSIRINTEASASVGTGQAQAATMYNTYYYLARQADYMGANDTTLYDGTCMPVAMVPARFSDSVCVEGSGVLADGRVINYNSSCRCGRACPTGGIVCYQVLDKRRFPWGLGARGNALVPLRSWAVDRAVLPLGTVVYLPRWDGVMVPAVDGLGGFVHDGCFRADDTGGAIVGNHFDYFAGTAGMWRALERIFPTRTNFEVRRAANRCDYLTR